MAYRQGNLVPSQPETQVFFVDDFLHTASSNSNGQQMKQDLYGGGGQDFNTTYQSSAHPGVFAYFLTFNTGGANSYYTYNESTSPTYYVGGGESRFVFISLMTPLSTATDAYVLRIGLGDTFASDFTDGIYFEYTDTGSSPNWLIKTANSGSRTSQNSGVAASTNWTKFEIVVNATATSVSYFINDVQVSNSPITTNIPATTTGMIPMWQWNKTAGNNQVNNARDYFSYTKYLSALRY
jgi:hypothetical protein